MKGFEPGWLFPLRDLVFAPDMVFRTRPVGVTAGPRCRTVKHMDQARAAVFTGAPTARSSKPSLLKSAHTVANNDAFVDLGVGVPGQDIPGKVDAGGVRHGRRRIWIGAEHRRLQRRRPGRPRDWYSVLRQWSAG